jgi:ubiquitin C-terminal hydrolase
MIKGELVPEEISGYHCDHCTERQTAVRTTYIWKLPRYVVVVLKRFGSNGQRINTPLSMESHKVSFKAFMTPDSPETSSAQDYTLCGMVDHHGGAQGGHYTAQCNTNGAWQVYDDESSNPIEKPIIGRATYMMWFEVPPTS